MDFRRVSIFAFAALLTASAGLSRAAAPTPAEIAAESAKANAFFDRTFDEVVARYPEFQSDLGLKSDQDKWNDGSEARLYDDLALTARRLAELKSTINVDALDAQTRISYRLWVRQAERQLEGFKWRDHDYPVNPLFGVHSDTPAFLINTHRIDSEADARAYIARLHGIGPRFDQLIAGLERRRAKGVVPPKFVFPLVIGSARNVIAGAPFDASGRDTPLLADFAEKIAKVDLSPATRDALLAEARLALTSAVKPAYERLIAELESLAAIATDDDGVWKLPEGRAYYDFTLAEHTTTTLDADAIHAIGLAEVARINAEMDAIRTRVGFAGDRAAFFKFMREDPRFCFPNTPEGKAAYLADATRAIDDMRARLDQLFITQPRAALVVKPVEAFRERESAGAFYQQPAPDGSRPGVYYVNLGDMAALPRYELPALAFHEGIPGHHMQIAIAQELRGLPKFRRLGFGYTAYVEGWALYCEQLAKEAGFYTDPYDDFGRLSMELLRAARLVVDTGLHAKKWTREQTIRWLRENTPNSERDIVTETNRYIVMPGQATAYKVGMNKILELRARARERLGAKFDLREFHDVVLRDGALPLDLLEENVDAWIARTLKP